MRSGSYEQSPENLCLDCLGSGWHLESAHDPQANPPEAGDWAARRPINKGEYHPTWVPSTPISGR